MKRKRYNETKKKAVICSVFTAFCLINSSFATYDAQAAEAELQAERYKEEHWLELCENQNRLEIEGYEFKRLDSRNGDSIAIYMDAQYVAKVLYGMKKHGVYSDDALRAAVWVIENRLDTSWYPDTIKGVCEQSQQFYGYNKDNRVEERLMNIAVDELTKYFVDGERGTDKSYLYMELTSYSVILRDNFNKENGTHYIEVK